MSRKFRILVCPLNWGLGHATRMVPIINELLNQNFEIIIAADGEALQYLKLEFPTLKTINLKQYNVKYSKRESLVFRMITLAPRIFFFTLKEHRILKKIIAQENIDCVISDNRYGLWNKSVYSVFITHQLRIILPTLLRFFEQITTWFIKRAIANFDECWIPDFKDQPNLTGELSHPFYYKNLFYIGLLSRFEEQRIEKANYKYDCLVILSGPEPQRSLFEEKLFNQLKFNDYKAALVRGVSSEMKVGNEETIDVFGLLNSKELVQLINRSETVICRSGYSSVMDLVALRKTAVLVPTPGQTEQEYLARYLLKNGLFYTLTQREFCIDKALKNKIEFPKVIAAERTAVTTRINNLRQVLEKKKDN